MPLSALTVSGFTTPFLGYTTPDGTKQGSSLMLVDQDGVPMGTKARPFTMYVSDHVTATFTWTRPATAMTSFTSYVGNALVGGTTPASLIATSDAVLVPGVRYRVLGVKLRTTNNQTPSAGSFRQYLNTGSLAAGSGLADNVQLYSSTSNTTLLTGSGTIAAIVETALNPTLTFSDGMVGFGTPVYPYMAPVFMATATTLQSFLMAVVSGYIGAASEVITAQVTMEILG